MKIAVFSDTHDQIEEIIKALNYVQNKVEAIIHCGDWVSPFILQHFQKVSCPIYGVFGNNDGDKFRHLLFKESLNLPLTLEDRFLELEFDQKKIAVFHGDYAGIINALIHSQHYDAVFHGHTHLRVNEKFKDTLSFNPGSFVELTTEQIRGASFGIYDTKSNSAEHILLSSI